MVLGMSMRSMTVHKKPAAHVVTVRTKPAARAAPVRKKVAASVEQPSQYEPPVDMEREAAAEPMDWVKAPEFSPCWASHLVSVLQQHAHMPSTRLDEP